jgi:hypothetical protein
MSAKYLYKKYHFFLLSYVKNPYEVSNIPKMCTDLILCFIDRSSRYNRIKKNQLDAQLILSIFRQPLHVSGVSSPIIRRYDRMYTTTGTYYFKYNRMCTAILVGRSRDRFPVVSHWELFP